MKDNTRALLEQALAFMVRAELLYGQPNQSVQEAIRTELAKPTTEVVVTKNQAGQIVAVTRQDDDGRIVEVIAESAPTPAQHDAPETIALKAERDSLKKVAERYRYLRGQRRWSEALEKAINAAIAKAEGGAA